MKISRSEQHRPEIDAAWDSRSAPDFALTLERLDDGTMVLALAGELDLYRAPEIEEALAQASDVDRTLTVDLRSLTFLDSTLLVMLLDATRRQRARGSELDVLVGPQTPMTAFEVTGFHRLLAIRRMDGDPA